MGVEDDLIIYEGSEVDDGGYKPDVPSEESKEDADLKKKTSTPSFTASASLKKDATGNHVLEVKGSLQLDPGAGSPSLPFEFKGAIVLDFEKPLVIERHECCQCAKGANTASATPAAPPDIFATPVTSRFETPRNSGGSWGGGSSYDKSPTNSFGGRSDSGGYRGGRGGGGRGGGGARAPRGDDWNCDCGINNFAFRQECFKCKAPKPAGGGGSSGGGGYSNTSTFRSGGDSWGSGGGGRGGGGGSWGSGGGTGGNSQPSGDGLLGASPAGWGPPSSADGSESRGWGRGGGKRSSDFDGGNDNSNKRFRGSDFGGSRPDTSAYTPLRSAPAEDSWE